MLRMTRKTLLAIEAVIIVARNSRGAPISSSAIADLQEITNRVNEPVMQHLVQAGILKGVRGPRGGYLLSRDGRDISVGEIVRAFDFLEGDEEHTLASPLCLNVLIPLCKEVDAMVIEKLDRISIASLCADAKAVGSFNDTDSSLMRVN